MRMAALRESTAARPARAPRVAAQHAAGHRVRKRSPENQPPVVHYALARRSETLGGSDEEHELRADDAADAAAHQDRDAPPRLARPREGHAASGGREGA